MLPYFTRVKRFFFLALWQGRDMWSLMATQRLLPSAPIFTASPVQLGMSTSCLVLKIRNAKDGALGHLTKCHLYLVLRYEVVPKTRDSIG